MRLGGRPVTLPIAPASPGTADLATAGAVATNELPMPKV